MFLTYTPEGGQPQVFEFSPGRVRQSRAEMLERRYSKLAGEKLTWDQFKMDVVKGSASARRVLLWHFLSQQHPTLRVEDVDPYEDELVLQFSRKELEDMRAEVAKSPLSDLDKDTILAKFDEEIATAPDSDLEGKAP